MMELNQLIAQASTTLDRFRLDRKVAPVAGGSRGLGQAMALALAAAGADRCIVGRKEEDLKKTVVAIVFAVVFAGMLGHTFWYEGVGRIGVTKTLIYLYFIPIRAALFNYFFMGERIYPQQILRDGLILLGIHDALRE